MSGGVRDSGVRTGGAKPVELQLGAIDPCGCHAGSLAVDRVSDVLQINIGDAAAARADEMVVIVGVRVVLDRTTGALERGDEPRANQLLQIAIDRGMRHRRQLAADFPKELIGRRMRARLTEETQQHLPLRGHPETALGGAGTQTLQARGGGGFFTTPNGQRGAMLRAYDKMTGADVGAVYMPAPQTGGPMTYMLGGRQYVVVSIAGGNYSAELVAFRLPG